VLAPASYTLRPNGGNMDVIGPRRRVVASRPMDAPGPLWLQGSDKAKESYTLDLSAGPLPSPVAFEFAGGKEPGARPTVIGPGSGLAALAASGPGSLSLAGASVVTSGTDGQQLSGVQTLNVVGGDLGDVFSVSQARGRKNVLQGAGLPALTFFNVRDLG